MGKDEEWCIPQYDLPGFDIPACNHASALPWYGNDLIWSAKGCSHEIIRTDRSIGEVVPGAMNGLKNGRDKLWCGTALGGEEGNLVA